MLDDEIEGQRKVIAENAEMKKYKESQSQLLKRHVMEIQALNEELADAREEMEKLKQ